MTTKTLKSSQKEFMNNAVRGLVNSATFTGELPPLSPVQGSNSGYTAGGLIPPSFVTHDVIDKFPFASDGNATDVGDLTAARFGASGQSSDVSGYSSGGQWSPSPTSRTNIIDKFPFASGGNATDVGDITIAKRKSAGQSSDVSGYASGGYVLNSSNVIDKFPFASDANATDVGDLTTASYNSAGQSSTTHGYTSGRTTVDKFSFATDGNATNVGILPFSRSFIAGQSSNVSGYVSVGASIDKFPFASDGNATTVGDLSVGRYEVVGQSSTVSGYTSGGYSQTPYASGSVNSIYNVVDKFPFASDGSATDVGDLTVARRASGGQQY